MKKVFALTIAGSDPVGSAGIQADLKTFQALGVYGASVITAVTAQNTKKFFSSFPLSPEQIQVQLQAVFRQFTMEGVKTGMLANSEIVSVVAQVMKIHKMKNLVVDPVLVSKTGFPLLAEEALPVLKTKLFPLALLVTPNIEEAELLATRKIYSHPEMEEAAKRIHAFGPRYVLIKGGKAKFSRARDLLYDGKTFQRIPGHFIANRTPHGTGCVYSTAITAYLALGDSLSTAIKKAKRYTEKTIRNAIPVGTKYELLNPVK